MKSTHPPRLFTRFFRWYCHPKLRDSIEGDLIELYKERKASSGKRAADLKFILDVLLLFRPGIIKPATNYNHLNTQGMLKNHFIISWRTLYKQRFYTFINISGLAIGIAACLIIVLFIADELSYDTYNAKSNRIHRVDAEVNFGGNEFEMTYRSAPEAQAMMNEYPEIESTVRLRTSGSYLVRTENGTENFKEKNVAWADSTFFNIFSVNVLEGNPTSALKEAATVAISKTIADKYFPGVSALGQSLILDNKYNAKITAVYEDIPATSHFHFDILVSMIGSWPIPEEAKSTSFMNESFITYLLLREGADAQSLESKLTPFLEKSIGPELVQAFGSDFTIEKFKSTGNKYNLSLTPLTDIHLYSNSKRGEFEPSGNITYVYLFASVAFLILVIACINFMNLSTARSGTRAKEVGVRKVMGSVRSHLVRQFLIESFLVTAVAVLASIALASLVMPFFNALAGKQLQLPLGNPLFYLVLLMITLSIGFIAGLYPSLFLSAFKPIQVLKGQSGLKSGNMRGALVVFQFMISIFLIIGTITVYQQLNYIQNKKLGFEKEQVLVVHDVYALRPNNVQAFKNEVLKIGAIENGTLSGYVPVENEWSWRSNDTFWLEGSQPTTENMVSAQFWGVDADYINTMQMHVTVGRDFSIAFPSDSGAIVINQSAAKRLGISDDPIGKKINTYNGPPEAANVITLSVIGVVEDFHFSSMKESISPLGLYLSPNDGCASFRFQPEHTHEVIQAVEEKWKQLAPGQPFQYSFLDEDFEVMYQSEQRLAKIFGLFAGLSIIIACLGLFGLTSFIAEQRTKEIGIRKTLGASINSIVVLLSKDFGKLILIAFVLSAPLAWYAINLWLEDYTYKTEIGLPVYLLAGVSAFVIALITMSYQSIKTAMTNPVKSLRSE